jgi:ferrous iron transport protein A
MSRVSARLGSRTVSNPATSAGLASAVRLADLRPGTTGRVIDIDPSVSPSTARRLFDLGFVPGGEVTVLRKAPLGDPVVFQVAQYEVALRTAQAAGIRVQLTA